MPYICDACGRHGVSSSEERWHEGVPVVAEDEEVIDLIYLCPECFARLENEEKPRWRELKT